MESDTNPLAKEICTEYSKLTEQPNFIFQVSFDAIVDREACNDSDVDKTQLLHDGFVNLIII